MSTSSKFAVTATLAMSAAIGFIGIQSLPAMLNPSAQALHKQVSQDVLQAVHPLTGTVLKWVAEPLQAQFVPDPSEPPTGTGGTGTR